LREKRLEKWHPAHYIDFGGAIFERAKGVETVLCVRLAFFTEPFGRVIYGRIAREILTLLSSLIVDAAVLSRHAMRVNRRARTARVRDC